LAKIHRREIFLIKHGVGAARPRSRHDNLIIRVRPSANPAPAISNLSTSIAHSIAGRILQMTAFNRSLIARARSATGRSGS
jgi:hypothetical protein